SGTRRAPPVCMQAISSRLGFVSVLLSTIVTGAICGCSITATVPNQTDVDPTHPDAAATPSTTTGASDAGSSVVTVVATADAGNATNGQQTSTSSGSASPPNAVCNANSAREVEPNNTADSANTFGDSLSFCGNIGPGDVDYVSFQAPEGLK